MNPLDRRLNAYRPDLADRRLKGQVKAERFGDGEARIVRVPICDLRPEPRGYVNCDTQLLFGEPVRLFDENGEGWSWVQSEVDGYVGYVESEALGQVEATPTHIVASLRSYRYPRDELRAPPIDCLSIGSRVTVTGSAERRGTAYAMLTDGSAMIASHLVPIGHTEPDYVEVARLFINSPYLWAGRSGFGIDCSSLVQLSMMRAGMDVLRDTDMQVGTIGTELGTDWTAVDYQRGDLIFWPGHVAILTGPDTIIHANGHTMSVIEEKLEPAIERIERLYTKPNMIRRPDRLGRASQ